MAARPSLDELFQQVATEYGTALERLAYAYEADSDRCRIYYKETAVLINLRLARKYQGRINALNVALRSTGDFDKKN